MSGIEMQRQEIISFLTEAGRWAPSADNTQPWRFCWDGRSFSLRYDAVRIGESGFSMRHQATLLAMGAVVENILQAAAAVGLKADWKWQIPRGEPYEFFSMELEASELQSRLPQPLPLFARHTNRLPFYTKRLPEAFLDYLQDQSGDRIVLQVIEGKDRLKMISRLIRNASMARFRTKEIHEWFAASLRFSRTDVGKGDGLDIETFGLPFGGKALLSFISTWSRMSALNSLGGYKLLASIEAASITKAGAVVAIVGESGMEASLEAGRVMERIWIEANAAGLGVQPYFVVSDQIIRLAEGRIPRELVAEVVGLERDARNALGLDEGKSLHMLLRMGYPVKAAVRSMRLPMSLLFASDS